MATKPAVGLVAGAGRRRATLEMGQRLEREGFTGLYCPSPGDGLALCEALALSTRDIPFGTSIANIYTRHPFEYAQTAAVIHELSNGRFKFGIGVSHGPIHERLGLRTGKPLEDVRKFVADVGAHATQVGGLPPIVLATLRRRMVELAGEIAQGVVWANGARSHMAASLRGLPASARQDPAFFIGNMVPTCIDADRAAAAALLRRILVPYVRLPNYQNYWIEAGYEEEMLAIRGAIARGEPQRIPELMSDRWLQDITLFGSAAEVREGVEAWLAAGVRTLIVVMSSTRGGALEAAVKTFGKLDTLVNNAGDGGPTKPVQDYTAEEWFYTINSCLTSSYMCTRFAVPQMITAGGGAIVNIASTAGRHGLAYRIGYCSAKAGQVGMTYGLALELAAHNIRVNAIPPGAIAGDRIDRVIAGQAPVKGVPVEEERRRWVERSPLKRMSTAEDIASLAVYLCSDAARNLSGQCIAVTAGEPAL